MNTNELDTRFNALQTNLTKCKVFSTSDIFDKGTTNKINSAIKMEIKNIFGKMCDELIMPSVEYNPIMCNEKYLKYNFYETFYNTQQEIIKQMTSPVSKKRSIDEPIQQENKKPKMNNEPISNKKMNDKSLNDFDDMINKVVSHVKQLSNKYIVLVVDHTNFKTIDALVKKGVDEKNITAITPVVKTPSNDYKQCKYHFGTLESFMSQSKKKFDAIIYNSVDITNEIIDDIQSIMSSNVFNIDAILSITTTRTRGSASIIGKLIPKLKNEIDIYNKNREETYVSKTYRSTTSFLLYTEELVSFSFLKSSGSLPDVIKSVYCDSEYFLMFTF